MLVDDCGDYKKPAETIGAGFVSAPRIAKPGTVEDNTYLYETLLRTVHIADIHKSINESDTSAKTKLKFKKQLISYQIGHLTQVADWQKTLLIEDSKLAQTSTPVMPPNEQAIKHVLQGLQYLITDTQWDIGLFGGVKIMNSDTGECNTIPKGMSNILIEITKAQEGKQSWQATLNQVEMIAQRSADKKDHGFFNKRGETTPLFYDKAKTILSELRMEQPVDLATPVGPILS